MGIIGLMGRKKTNEYIHTVTRLGTVSIPVPLRRKYNITKGSKIKFVDSSDGIRLVPLVSLKNLFSAYKERGHVVNSLIREILAER
jgi:bifunctional DNA-binding transcriptional regulator/antitoxin component of YhaV-PrlF toxin-antitoxin module